jgi:Na+/H+ antiporter NhaD/arsenite permease-like protein
MTSSRAPHSAVPSRWVRRSIRRLFLNPGTGRLTVVQWPNISLSVFIVISIVLHAIHLVGGVEIFARVLADLAIFVWAIDELMRGVNPFRRALGMVVLITTCVSVLLAVH